MTADRERLRVTFNSAAQDYYAARPDYPPVLYDDLIARAGLAPGARLLEVGCGPGKATLPLAQRGFRITGVELGASLADAARENLADYPAVEVITANFETWQPAPGVAFDLVYAATAWHWIDPAVGCQRAWDRLRPGGHLAIWSATHVSPDGGDPFFAELQDVYDEINEGMPPGERMMRPAELPSAAAAIEATGLFEEASARWFDWEISYTADDYIRLLDTFSGHIAMADWQRDRLYSEIRRRLALRPDGLLRRHWGVVLDIARRRDHPEAGPGTAEASNNHG
jgi:SAM-dependent methyltransferase